MQRRSFLSFIALASIGGIAGCVEESVSVEEVKEQAKKVEYDELNRNYEDYIGEYLYFPEAGISDANKDGDDYSYHVVAITESSAGSMWVSYDERFLEGDKVEIWGEVMEIDNAYNEPDLKGIEINRLENGG